MKDPVKDYNKLVVTDETKEKLNNMLEKNKVKAEENIIDYVDLDHAMEVICSREFYDITRFEMQNLNKHIDFYNDNVNYVFETFADERETLWNKIKENGYRV